MTEKFKESIDKSNAFGALLTDFLKACDSIDYTLLIAGLSAFLIIKIRIILFIESNLANQNQRKFYW